MIVPKYWAEGRVQHREKGKQVTVRRFGWSHASESAAQAHADARAAEALQGVLSGEKLERREPKVAYNGAEGVPIREEIVAEHGPTILTRNSYGAVCLNTPDVLFADIDFEQPSTLPLGCSIWVLLKMCQRQRCFRARVSPKPWRMGIAAHLKPRPGIWPVRPEALPARREWLRAYDEKAAGFAACQFETELGDSGTDPKAQAVQRLHDELCRCDSGLPMA